MMVVRNDTCDFKAAPSRPACTGPAVWHGWIDMDDPDSTPIMACDDHAPAMKGVADDWHRTGPVCDKSGTHWLCRERPGDSFCYHPAEVADQYRQLTETSPGVCEGGPA